MIRILLFIWIVCSILSHGYAKDNTNNIVHYPSVECDVQVYPKSVQWGDTVYMCIKFKNPHDKSIKIFLPFARQSGSAQLVALNVENPFNRQITPLYEEAATNEIGDRSSCDIVSISPNEERTVFATSFNLPALEDTQTDFWKTYNITCSEGTKECPIDIQVFFYFDVYAPEYFGIHTPEHTEYSDKTQKRQPFKDVYTLQFSLRQEDEMKLVEKWYVDTPSRLFPKIRNLSEPVNPEFSGHKVPRSYIRQGSNNRISIQGKAYFPWNFVQTGNRYPGDPNCPETWQGWKELEESLTPSTMRDEIRMTRIVIQYCDTEDSTVLDELTEWLQNMNEIQRVVMVQNVMNLPNNSPKDENIRASLNKLIETIRPFSAEISPAAEEILR